SAIWFAVGILVLAATIALTFVNAGRPGTTAVAGSAGAAEEDEAAVPVVAHSATRPADPAPPAVPLRAHGGIRASRTGEEGTPRPVRLPRTCPGRSAQPGQVRTRVLGLESLGDDPHDLAEGLLLFGAEPVEDRLAHGLH